MVLGLVWLTIISIGIILISIVWNSDNDPWNNMQKLLFLTHRQIYYIVLILFISTISAICIIFLSQYFILPANLPTFYAHQLKARIPGIKHKVGKNDHPNEPLLTPKDDHKSDSESKRAPEYTNTQTKGAQSQGSANIKQAAVLKRDRTIERNESAQHRCSRACKHLFTADWTLYNWMCILVVLYHLFNVVVLITSFWCKKTNNEITDHAILIVYHISRAFGDTMPGICLIMYWKAKEIYDPVDSYIKKLEKKILSKELRVVSNSRSLPKNRDRKDSKGTTENNADRFQYADNTKTLAAVHSILSKCAVKTWLLFAIGFGLYSFLFWPALNAKLFQDFLGDYRCEYNEETSMSVYNDLYFILQMCILRPFNGMVLTYSMFLTLPVGRHHSSTLEGFKSILSPTIFGIIMLFGMCYRCNIFVEIFVTD